MAKISRKVLVTSVEYSIVCVNDGQASLEPSATQFIGGLKPAQIQRKLQKQLGDNVTFAVTSCVTSERQYEMDLAKFLKLATDVTDVQCDDGATSGDSDDGDANETGASA